jgi:phenylalanyl-tRNA synthetase beta chain
MKISWNWLHRHVDLTDLDPHTIGNRFTMSVAELEGIEEFGGSYHNIVTARILSLRPHEDAEKLQLLDLDLGTRKVTAISGAPGIQVDTIIPFALPGTRLEGVEGAPEVKVVEIRGVSSPGVTCSERELGFSDDHTGLLVLPPETPVGKPLTDILPCHDYILEIDNKSITHRPDLWGHRGLAREVAALVKRPLKTFDATIPETDANPLTVKVEDPDLCPRYAAQVFEGIAIEPSPLWLKISLSRIGVRPISNVVDLTNFVMLDVGNPLHAFDARFLGGNTIIVRRARPDETIVTLDGMARPLNRDDLLIADADRGVALAGVMGGENSEIRTDTSRVVLEAAAFQASGIRRTSSRLGLRTEASARFEKALDPGYPLQATALFSRLLREICPSVSVASRLYDVAKPEALPTVIHIMPDTICRKLGAEISAETMVSMLTGIEFKVIQDEAGFHITVPSFRATKDIAIPEDIVEEIGRLHGYDNIVPVPLMAAVQPVATVVAKSIQHQVKQTLMATGYREVLSYSFDSVPHAQSIGYDLTGALELANPISAEMPVMRRHLIPNHLLHAVKNAQFRDEFRFFEVGRTFSPAHGPDEIPHQERRVAGLVYARAGDGFTLFRLIRRHVEKLGASLQRGELTLHPLETDDERTWVVPGSACEVYLDDVPAGVVSILSPVVRSALKIRGRIAFFELNLEPFFSHPEKVRKFVPLPRYPSIQNDLSVIVDMDVSYASVETVIRKVAGPLLADLTVFAIFRGDPIPAGKKSLSFHLHFRSQERTLQDIEIKPLVEKVIESLRLEVDGEIRT